MERTFDDDQLRTAYGYLLARALVVRQERRDLAEEGVDYNVIKHNPLGSAEFVNPNFDVAYLEAWVAVDDETPVLLEIPRIEGRYYTAQFLDEWGEVIVNINERNFSGQPSGTFALVAPGAAASAPDGAVPIELHSDKAKMLARVELQDSPDDAVDLARQFTLRSVGTPRIAPTIAIDDFDNQHLADVGLFDHANELIDAASDVCGAAAEPQRLARSVAAYVASSPEARAEIDRAIHADVVPWFLAYAVTKSGVFRNGWLGTITVGNYGDDYLIRSAANLVGIWANSASECIYFVGTRGGDGQPLDGSRSYRLHFGPGDVPAEAVDGYWSIILVSLPDYRVIPNPDDRFNLNSYSPLEFGDDGSLDLYCSPVAPDGPRRANWLPTPDGHPFSLTFRTYIPRANVRAGEWFPPAIESD